MIDVIATILILYLLYKLVFDFIVPVSRTTAQFKNHVNEMRNRQEQMRTQQQNQANNSSRAKAASNKTSTTTTDKTSTTTTDGEYIDFEEVK
jgi:Sec-independent protein translocase protein TatA